jgi:hypothetical protein
MEAGSTLYTAGWKVNEYRGCFHYLSFVFAVDTQLGFMLLGQERMLPSAVGPYTILWASSYGVAA